MQPSGGPDVRRLTGLFGLATLLRAGLGRGREGLSRLSVLVAYASRYGATREIAERVAETPRASGLEARAQPVKAVADLAGYDAFVVGSAAYYGSWLKEAAAFVRRHQASLAGRPVWLFSSGPISADPTDAEGRDQREAAVPKEIAELEQAIHPRDHRVFFGRLDRGRLGLMDRLVARMPAFPGSEGDFRDWADVEGWARGMAQALSPVAAGGR
jgi:menaquinone-dependent protoporphyrinogen oxidase